MNKDRALESCSFHKSDGQKKSVACLFKQ